jgi:hypothetical protein
MVEQKRTGRWRLTEEASIKGVQATIRYRSRRPKPNKLKRTPKRQAPGAKGGRATARAKKSRLELLAPDGNIGCSTTPEAGAHGSLLPAYSNIDFGADALFCTDQAYMFDHSATFFQPGMLVDQWGRLGDAEMGFAANDGLFAQLRYQGFEGVTLPFEFSLPGTLRND